MHTISLLHATRCIFPTVRPRHIRHLAASRWPLLCPITSRLPTSHQPHSSSPHSHTVPDKGSSKIKSPLVCRLPCRRGAVKDIRTSNAQSAADERLEPGKMSERGAQGA
eukprot:scaffold84013_cov28-Tisochrysis_lutea.AAC.3